MCANTTQSSSLRLAKTKDLRYLHHYQYRNGHSLVHERNDGLADLLTLAEHFGPQQVLRFQTTPNLETL